MTGQQRPPGKKCAYMHVSNVQESNHTEFKIQSGICWTAFGLHDCDKNSKRRHYTIRARDLSRCTPSELALLHSPLFPSLNSLSQRRRMLKTPMPDNVGGVMSQGGDAVNLSYQLWVTAAGHTHATSSRLSVQTDRCEEKRTARIFKQASGNVS